MTQHRFSGSGDAVSLLRGHSKATGSDTRFVPSPGGAHRAGIRCASESARGDAHGMRRPAMSRAIGTFLVVLYLFVLGCNSQGAVGGDGWRLLYADERPQYQELVWQPWQVGGGVIVATDRPSWDSLWTDLALGTAQPDVDFTREIAAVFGHDRSRDCSIRLDSVEIDKLDRVVFSQVTQYGSGCTLFPGHPAIHAVALERAALPDSPFFMRADTNRCDHPEELASVPDCGPMLNVEL